MKNIFILFIFIINFTVSKENQNQLPYIKSDECSNNYIFPFILGRTLKEIRKEEMFKGKISGSNEDRFKIYKKVKTNNLASLKITAVGENIIFHGDILIDKKSNLIAYNLWIKVSDKNFLKNFYDKLGSPAIDLKDQPSPKEWKDLDKFLPKKWTYKKWDLINCNSTLIIQEMPLDNPVYDSFIITAFYNEFSQFFKDIG